ncbi:MAG TPA: DUF1206 domain-containing protein [Gemmatimonadales bacterium]|nr:DUF1206 domain-containing protein [Gemmatimonadales bacterium]
MATLTVPTTARPWIERLARVGYLAKGAVYLLIGVLALQAAAGSGGRTTDTSGAFEVLLRQPFGNWLLWLVAIGLAGYGVWRLVCAAVDPEHRGEKTGWKRRAVRVGYAISGSIHGGLAWEAARLAMGDGGGQGGQADSRTAQLMNAPFGPWLVGLAALGVAGYGVAQIVRGFRRDAISKMRLSELGADERRMVLRAARAGLVSRGVVFGLIALFLARAALHHDPSEAGGLREALQTLARQPYAPFVLGAVALGLAAYGAYQLALARYRVIAAG